MIRTERQYKVGRARRDELAAQLDNLGAVTIGSDVDTDDWTTTALRSAVLSQVSELDAELTEYELLRSGALARLPEIDTLDALPRTLIQARIASGLTQRELAHRLGLREQQIQRYEAEEYAGAGLSRIRDVMAALDVSLNAEVTLPPQDVQLRTLRKRLVELGLSARVAMQRVLRADLSEAAQPTGSWMLAAVRAARVFDARVEDLLAGNVQLQGRAVALRANAGADQLKLSAYAVYAEYIGSLLERACTTPRQPLSADPKDVRAVLGDMRDGAPLERLLRYCWEHGLPVLPLSDQAAFHGACWQMETGPVIALKQRTESQAKWSFDLTHELHHAANLAVGGAVLEDDEDLVAWKQRPEEMAADQFSGDVLLGPRAEAIAQVAAQQAGGNVARLKSIVPEVAAAGDVAPDVLAYYLAHRLAANGISWWGAARSFDSGRTDPWLTARNILFEHVDLTQLDEVDRGLLMDALAP